ncbi:MAG TPA: class I SAM-dependent methyltransferase [Acidimicrobiales bacterium]|nr:class I SAM-dependent methyltransferase [Acidimicrobiales bacterium]
MPVETDCVRTETARCPLCGPMGAVTVVHGEDRELGLPGRYAVIRCQGCGLLRTDPRPTLETMGYYYPDSYAPYALEGAVSEVRTGRARRHGWARRLLDARDHAVPPLPPGRLLELGCASGQFLATMAAKGWQVQGIEPSPAAAGRAAAQGFDVINAQVELVTDLDEQFDLIAAWMVLEHLHDPIQVLTRMRAWVKPSGWLALSVPNAASVERRIFRSHWYALQLPRHLYHFEPDTLAHLLQAAGWRVAGLHQQRTLTNLVGSCGRALEAGSGHRLGTRLVGAAAHSRLLRVAAFPAAAALAALGQTGRMTVWARPGP